MNAIFTKKPLFLLLFLSWFQTQLQAEHVLGSELTYKFVSDYTVEVTLTIYRDCTECKFNGQGGGNVAENCSEIPPILVQGVNAMGEGLQNLFSIVPTYKEVVNITNTCEQATNACHSVQNPDLMAGVEKHVLVGEFDLNEALFLGFCKLYLSSRIFSRPASVVPAGIPPPVFYNFSVLDFCEPIRTSSVHFEVDPIFYVNSNSPVYHSPGIVRGDADSISVNLVSAQDPHGPIPYIAGTDSSRPLQVHCGGAACISDPIANPPRGFFVDPNTGNTVFTPTQHNQSGTLVYEIVKWKKNNRGILKPVSIVRRDFVIQTMMTHNKAPVFEQYETVYNLCMEQDEPLHIPVENEVNQTLYFVAGSTPEGLQLKTQETQPTQDPQAYFEVKTELLKPDTTYYVTLWVTDNHCPLSAMSSRTFVFHTFIPPQVAIDIEEHECGKIVLKAFPEGLQPNQYQWNVVLPQDTQLILNGSQTQVQYTDGGEIQVLLEVSTMCRASVWDSIHLDAFTLPHIEVPSRIEACLDDRVTIEPDVTGGLAPYTFYWDHVLSTATKQYNVPSEQINVNIWVRDQLGCEATQDIQLGAYEHIPPVGHDIRVCAYSSQTWSLPKDEFEFVSTYHYGLYALNPEVRVQNFTDMWGIDPEDCLGLDTLQLVLFHENSQGCVSSDTFTLSKHYPDLPIEIIEPTPVCRASEPINWYTYFGITMQQGFFTSIPDGCVSDSGIFNPQRVLDNVEQVEFLYHSYDTFCYGLQQFSVRMQEPRNFDFSFNPYVHYVCLHSYGTPLGGEEDGVVWSGPGVRAYQFFSDLPEVPKGEPFFIYFDYSDPVTGCKVWDSAVYFVPEYPSHSLLVRGKELINTPDSQARLCIAEAPYDLFWKLQGSPESFPFDFTLSWKTEQGSQHGDIWMPDPKGGLHRIILQVEQDKCNEWSGTDTLEIWIDRIPEVQLQSSHDWVCWGTDSFQMQIDAKHTSQAWLYIHDTFATHAMHSWTHIHSDWSEELSWSAPYPGEYRVYVDAVQGSCSARFDDMLSVQVEKIPKPHIVSNPERVIPADFKLIRLKDEGVYLKEPLNRVWEIENRSVGSEVSFSYRTFLESGTVSIVLEVEDSLGCVGVDSKMLVVGTPLDIFIPTAFSPNCEGPEKNNVFRVTAGEVNDFEMQIMNRWGEVVFVSNTPDRGWDGTYLNEPCKPGVYAYYIVFVNQFGARKEFKGTLTLVR